MVMLQAQNLIKSPPPHPTRENVLSVIRQMGALQIDTINVVARSPYLSLWSRLGDYDPEWLDDLLGSRRIFEYWSHAACFLPMEDFPYYRRLCLAGWRNYFSKEWYSIHKEDCDRVLQHIQQNGEVKSATFKRQDGKKGTWWDWKIEKVALEYWFARGDLMVSRRERFQRVYDLRERILPDWNDLDAPSLEETLAFFCLKTLRALGVALPSWVADYFRLPRRDVARMLKELKDQGRIVEVGIEGMTETALAAPEALPMIEAASQGKLEPHHTTLLSPFDALIWDRKRTKQLFGFDYTIEVYQPQHKRIYGYYTLPILHRGRLLGRVDAKAHRQNGDFEVRSIHLEPGEETTNELYMDLAGALQSCADWHRTPHVILKKTQPAEIQPILGDYFQQRTL
jgi:hypothetical protein